MMYNNVEKMVASHYMFRGSMFSLNKECCWPLYVFPLTIDVKGGERFNLSSVIIFQKEFKIRLTSMSKGDLVGIVMLPLISMSA